MHERVARLLGPGFAAQRYTLHRVRDTQPIPKKKAARFPERPFLSYGGCTFPSGDFGASRPGAYLPIES